MSTVQKTYYQPQETVLQAIGQAQNKLNSLGIFQAGFRYASSRPDATALIDNLYVKSTESYHVIL